MQFPNFFGSQLVNQEIKHAAKNNGGNSTPSVFYNFLRIFSFIIPYPYSGFRTCGVLDDTS